MLRLLLRLRRLLNIHILWQNLPPRQSHNPSEEFEEIRTSPRGLYYEESRRGEEDIDKHIISQPIEGVSVTYDLFVQFQDENSI